MKKLSFFHTPFFRVNRLAEANPQEQVDTNSKERE